jgi:hypothetical protein
MDGCSTRKAAICPSLVRVTAVGRDDSFGARESGHSQTVAIGPRRTARQAELKLLGPDLEALLGLEPTLPHATLPPVFAQQARRH